MTQPRAETAAAPPSPLWKAVLRDRHFLVAAAILIVAAAGWEAATTWLGIHARKEPVVWPSGVTVGDDFRLMSLADDFPLLRAGGAPVVDANGKPVIAFKRVAPNDELSRVDPNYRWEVISSTDLETLSIGTSVDKANLPKRCCNWYVSRIYRDARPGAAVGSWRLQAYYYTGGGDTVPHVPEICVAAGGAKLLQDPAPATIRLRIPSLAEDWAKDIPFSRAWFRRTDGFYAAEYYTFSMNGTFGDSRLWVRWELLNPFIRSAYFAKIQFGPASASPVAPSAATAAAMDGAAEEFLRHALPEVLKALPSPRDVQRQEQSR